MDQRSCRLIVFLCCMLSLFVLAGCEREQQPAEQQPAEQQQPEAVGKEEGARAEAKLQPTEGNQASGTVTFETADGGVRVVADLQGLAPGRHGFHVHENGDCSAPDASSAGEHFNPTGTPHGPPTAPAEQRHVGDLGNVEAGEDGKARLEIVDQAIALEGENSIVGKAVVVHSDPDDLNSQPSGNAGARVACGVIEVRK